MRIKIRGGRILILSMLPRRLAVIAGCMLPILSAADWPAYRGPAASGVGQGPAPYQSDAREHNGRNRWQTSDRVFRLRRSLQLHTRRPARVAKGSGYPRHGAIG